MRAGARLALANEIVRGALVTREPWSSIAEAIHVAIPGRGGLIYDWRAPTEIGRMVASFPIDPRVDRAAREHLPRLVMYRRDVPERRRDPRTVGEIFRRGPAEKLAELRERIFRPADIEDHLRVLLWDRGRLFAWVGALRATREHFRTTDRNHLRALAPRILSVLQVERALDGARDVLGVVDALPAPAFLRTTTGLVVHANSAARRIWPEVPQWLRHREIDRSVAHVARVGAGPLRLDLVLPRRAGRSSAPAITLPPSLEAIAHELAAGLTDKEIADRLQRPVATVRTYMQRLYGRLGVSHRVVAARMLWRAGYGDEPEADAG